MIFNTEQIERTLEGMSDLLENIKSDPTKVRETGHVREQIGFLNDCRGMAWAVDQGDSFLAPVLAASGGKRYFYPEMQHACGSIEPYLNRASETEVALVGNLGRSVRDEPALLFLYEGEHGAVANLRGMRCQTRDAYAVLAEKGCGSLGTQFLRSCLERPIKCGRKNFIFRGAPVRIPPELVDRADFMNTLQALVKEYLLKNVPYADGFVHWSQDGAEKIYGLASKDWWHQVEHPDIWNRVLNP